MRIIALCGCSLSVKRLNAFAAQYLSRFPSGDPCHPDVPVHKG